MRSVWVRNPLSVRSQVLDFGSILNETTKQMTLTMTNKELLGVNYKWVFVEEEQKDDQGAKAITIQGIDVAINQVFTESARACS